MPNNTKPRATGGSAGECEQRCRNQDTYRHRASRVSTAHVLYAIRWNVGTRYSLTIFLDRSPLLRKHAWNGMAFRYRDDLERAESGTRTRRSVPIHSDAEPELDRSPPPTRRASDGRAGSA